MKARFFSTMTLVGMVALSGAQLHLQRNFLTAGKDVFMFLPPEFVCGPTVKNTFWSQDGKHLAVEREFIETPLEESPEYFMGLKGPTSDAEIQLLVYSLVTKKVSKPISFKKSEGQLISVDWIAGSSSMAVEAMLEPPSQVGAHSTLAIVSPTGKVTDVKSFEPGNFHYCMPSPYKPIVLLLEQTNRAGGDDSGSPPGNAAVSAGAVDQAAQIAKTPPPPPTIRFFGLGGVLSDPITLPNRQSFPLWSKDGKLYVSSIVRTPGVKVSKRSWYTVDVASGKLTESAAPVDKDSFGRPQLTNLECENLSPKISIDKLGVSAPTVIVSDPTAKEKQFAIVSTDADRGEISPQENGVSYRAQGTLMVRPMVKVSLEAYLKARDAALKQQAINFAKQAALAAIMYANDYDDNYLAAGPNWKTQLEPYVKNMEILDGFNYTFAGGNGNQIESPADTQIGYSNGPGGRAVAYADGHVKWIPNP